MKINVSKGMLTIATLLALTTGLVRLSSAQFACCLEGEPCSSTWKGGLCCDDTSGHCKSCLYQICYGQVVTTSGSIVPGHCQYFVNDWICA